jgi:amino acid adenylation domain-containing protein/thioester reductase-like protein
VLSPEEQSSHTSEVIRVLSELGAEAVEPLSAEQRRLWLLGGLSGHQAVAVCAYRPAEPIDNASLQLRLITEAGRHEALRSLFTTIGDRPARLVMPSARVSVRVLDLPAENTGQAINGLLRQLCGNPFPLEDGPLLRAALVNGSGGQELLLAAHRLLADERSLDLLADAVLSPPLPGTSAATGQEQAPSVVRYERALASDPERRARLADWASELSAPAATEVTPERPRPPVKDARPLSLFADVPADLNSRLALDAEPVIQVAAAWLAVLMRRQAARSAVCGVHVPPPGGFAGFLGPWSTLRPVRGDLRADGTLLEIAGQVRDQLRDPTTDVPFAQLLEWHPPQRDLSRAPYVQTTVRLVNAVPADGPERLPVPFSDTEHDLAITLWLSPGRSVLRLDRDPQLYGEETASQLIEQLIRVLDALVSGDGSARVPLETLPLLNQAEAERSALTGAGHRARVPAVTPVAAIAAQAARTPAAAAVLAGEVTLTYAELWDRVLAVAARLLESGVRPGDRVGVMLRRSPDAVAAMLAVMSVGGVYVPLDPAYPAERLGYLLQDAEPAAVLTDSALARTRDLPAPTVPLDEAFIAAPPPTLPDIAPGMPAYMIYTSGTTGHPKGVQVQHGALANNLAWRQRTWPLSGSDRVLHNHSFNFDPSLWAALWPLTAGAAAVVAVEKELDDPAALLDVAREHAVTVIGGVPSLLSVLLDHPRAGEATQIRLVLSGAEPLTPLLLDKIGARWSARVANLYGPTEATIDATAYQVPPGPRRDAGYAISVPIGNAIDNVDVHVVDAALHPVPDGIPGELLVSGPGVAVGYHRRAALTAARFLPDPFSAQHGTRLYRTGDLVRRLPGGDLQFLGRVDDQVKIRGHRVEVQEIQAVLARCPGVRDAAVLPLGAGTENARLGAAVAADPGIDEQGLRSALADVLPAYLIPARITVLGVLPTGPNGKLDRAALSEELSAPYQAPDEVAEPRTELERTVAEAFARELSLARVDVHADFFQLGGTSIHLARLAALLEAEYGVRIPLHEFFHLPTAAGVAATIETYRREGIAGVLGRQHAATLERDARLDDSVRPGDLPRADWTSPRRVLLTGATGYLGLHLLKELLDRTSARVACLCRGKDAAHALERLREGFALYRIDGSSQLDRVDCLIGDLARPRLGLSQQQWDDLAGSLDAIYHNGALVNFVYPYSALKAPNVAGTQEVLRLACTTRLKAVHHISTIDTLLATHTPRPFLEVDKPLHSAVGVPAGYTGSKWVAEKVVDIARRRGVPVTIFRPGLILGHTRTGATQTIDYLLVALRGYLPLRILPDYPRIFDVVPVDYVARAVAHISLQPSAPGRFYHLFNPAPVPLSTFCEWIADYGYEFDIVPFEEGRRRALQVPPGHPLYPLVPLIRDAEASPHRALDPRYLDEVDPALECAGTLAMLADSGISCPPTVRDDAHAVLDYLVSVGFLPPPAGRRAREEEE